VFFWLLREPGALLLFRLVHRKAAFLFVLPFSVNIVLAFPGLRHIVEQALACFRLAH
jgi:hypothetical protein